MVVTYVRGHFKNVSRAIESIRVQMAGGESDGAIESQVLVDGANRGRTFADGGRDPFGRSGTDIADREQPWMAGFERQRGASECVPDFFEVLAPERSIREHKSSIVKGGTA